MTTSWKEAYANKLKPRFDVYQVRADFDKIMDELDDVLRKVNQKVEKQQDGDYKLPTCVLSLSFDNNTFTIKKLSNYGDEPGEDLFENESAQIIANSSGKFQWEPAEVTFNEFGKEQLDEVIAFLLGFSDK